MYWPSLQEACSSWDLAASRVKSGITTRPVISTDLRPGSGTCSWHAGTPVKAREGRTRLTNNHFTEQREPSHQQWDARGLKVNDKLIGKL